MFFLSKKYLLTAVETALPSRSVLLKDLHPMVLYDSTIVQYLSFSCKLPTTPKNVNSRYQLKNVSLNERHAYLAKCHLAAVCVALVVILCDSSAKDNVRFLPKYCCNIDFRTKDDFAKLIY